MKLKFIGCIFGYISFGLNCFSQASFQNGFIVTVSLDTIKGEINYRGDVYLGESCIFRPSKGADAIEYQPHQLVGYRLENGRNFISRETKSGRVFLEFLLNGELNLYYLRDRIGEHYFMDKDGFELVEIRYEEIVRYRGDTKQTYISPEYIGILNYYTQDAPEFQSQIKSMGRPRYRPLVKLAEEYHYKVCSDGEECITYRRKVKPFKFSPEFVYGFTTNGGPSSGLTSQWGCIVNFWVPRANERMYFRTGLLFSNTEINEGLLMKRKLPLQFEYIFNNGKIRPRAAYGLNVYPELVTSAAFVAGIDAKLTKVLFFSVLYELEFLSSEVLPIFPKSYLGQGLNIGLHIKTF